MPLLVLEDDIKDGDKLWNKVGSLDLISNGIKGRHLLWNTEGFSVGKYDKATLEIFDIKILGVADHPKLGGECGCKETKSLGVPEWSD